jgi:hypothetical protein
MLTCGARTPVDCTAPAVQHVQLQTRNGDRYVELLLCGPHFAELEAEYRRDWHAIGPRCAYPWRTWDYDSSRCVEDKSDNSTRYFTVEQLVQLLEDAPPDATDDDPDVPPNGPQRASN